MIVGFYSILSRDQIKVLVKVITNYTEDQEWIVLAVNDVQNRFYADYLMHKDALANSVILATTVSSEDLARAREDYATILLNRLIFIFFLQTSRGNRPAIIPENFLRTVMQDTGNQFHARLRSIWFDRLGTNRPRGESDEIFDKIPFLDCGLFSPHDGLELDQDGELLEIDIEGDALGNALDMLEQYTWTLDETECETTSNCITPSILGHIYERACNRKESGSYYTPDYITEYIIRKSVGLYLTTQVNHTFPVNYQDIIQELLAKEALDGNEAEHVAWLYFTIIRKMTVCDDACGSGAFLVAAARILVELHQSCIARIPRDHPGFQGRSILMDQNKSIDVIKQLVVTSNIFGVDIQPDSIEIAKLRLWLYVLSTIDLSDGNALPGLDRNLRAGNSLLGFINISEAWKNKLALNGDVINQQLEQLRACRRTLQDSRDGIATSESKQTLDTVMANLRENLDHAFFTSTGVSSVKNDRDLHLFHWCIEFPEIIDRGGFDVMVGNPPYLSFSSSKAKKEIIGKDITRVLYKDVDDVYEAFINRTRELCRGIAGMIVPYNFYKQLGLRMVKNLIEYDNLGEGIFIGVSIAVSILFFDKYEHDGFNLRNYVFQENKRDLLGIIPATRFSSFDLYKDDPVIEHVESVSRSHESYGLEVTRGEELGKKALKQSRDPGFIPIYTANEMTPFSLEPAAYFIDPGCLKKNFYDPQKIGVNLAFRNRIKASFIANVVTIKSIICIYNAPVPVLLEVLGTWNSKLFDWYQSKKYSNYQEIRLNTIDDIKARYPLLLIDRSEFQEIVKYLVISYTPSVHELIDFIIYEVFFNDKLVSDGIYPEPGFHLLDALGKCILSVDFDGWSLLHWKKMTGNDLSVQEETDLAFIEEKNKKIMETAVRAIQASDEVNQWIETIKSHPWIARIEEESAR